MKKEDPIEVGARLKAIRKKLKLSQKEFAASLDISASYLSEIESGKTKPGFNFTVLIYEKYNVNPGWLLVNEDDMFIQSEPKGGGMGFDFGGQTEEVKEMLKYMEQSPFVMSTVLSHFMKFLYENEAIIKRDVEKNKGKLNK